MSSPVPQRRLAAILAADMVGYSRLMEQDEAGTVARLKTDREEFIDPTIAEHGGRIVRLAGDGALIEFPSVVEATQCAIDIQQGMSERNERRPDNERIVFRMGVNVGDVLVEEDNLHGEGINVAARLESLADPGGILATEQVAQYVEGKVSSAFEFFDERTVKNIERPIRIYRARLDGLPGTAVPKQTWMKAARIGGIAALVLVLVGGSVVWFHSEPNGTDSRPDLESALPLPDKPSIAVLPFSNISSDEEQEYFADGMTDDLITDLSKSPALFVIASNSSFAYKGQSPDVRQVSRELGVRYVLEGSVRRSGNQVRINAQLVDAATGGHLWAERYDGELSDIFTLQDQVTRKIVTALAGHLDPDLENAGEEPPTSDPDAYDAFLRGMDRFRKWTPVDTLVAISLFEQSVSLDPSFPRGHAALAHAHWRVLARGWYHLLKIPANEAQRKALESLRRAMVDPTPLARRVAAQLSLYVGSHDQAIEEARRAVSLDPNDADSYATLAETLIWASRPEEAFDSLERALRLDPKASPFRYQHLLGIASYGSERYAAAVDYLEKAVESNPNDLIARMFLISSLGHLGLLPEARRQTDLYNKQVEVLNESVGKPIGRELTIASAEILNIPFHYREQADWFRFLEGLDEADVPDTRVGWGPSDYSSRR